MRTGNIMLGHNKKRISLTTGEYVSLVELKEVVSRYVNEHQEKRRIGCKKTGKSVNISTMSDDIAKESFVNNEIELDIVTDTMKKESLLKLFQSVDK